MNIIIQKYTNEDSSNLFKFENENRSFFEKMVPGRAEEYFKFTSFNKIMDGLLVEQNEGLAYFYLIKDEKGEILGRINLVDIEEGQKGYLGYRVAESATGKGVATIALALLLEEARKMGIIEIHAKTTHNNVGSQIVLERNQFEVIPAKEKGFIHYIWKKTSGV